MSLPTPRRGEIWLIDFNPGRGSEQTGRRLALIIQNDAGNQSRRYPNTVVLAMTKRGKPIPFHVRIEPAEHNGLEATSWVKCEQILTLSKSRLLQSRPIGRVTPEQLSQIEIGLKRSLQLL